MVSTVLRAVGLEGIPNFQNYHRVLSRAVWSSLGASRILLGLLVATFAPDGPVVLGIDETIERRRGAKITAAGIYRDPVRSSRSRFVKVNGLRWMCLMLLVPLPWAGRVWALPFLTALAPSQRYAQSRRRRHKPVTVWARQLLRQVHRWLPGQALVLVADSTYAALDLLSALRPVATVVTRLRLDAQLFAPAPPRLPHQKGRPRLVGHRLPTLKQHSADPGTAWTRLTIAHWYGRQAREVEVVSQTACWYHTGLPPVPIRWVLIRDPDGKFATQALLCTNLTASPEQILAWFVQRWQLEVTFHARGPIWAWRPSGNGRRWRLPAPLPRSSVSSSWLRCSPTLPSPAPLPAPADRVVCQDAPHLRRCPGPGAAPVVGVAAFSDIRAIARPPDNPRDPARPPVHSALLCSMIW